MQCMTGMGDQCWTMEELVMLQECFLLFSPSLSACGFFATYFIYNFPERVNSFCFFGFFFTQVYNYA